MIATGLIFLLGVLVATFVALLFLPLVWRKAQRLARRDFEATIPATAAEIQAGFDRVRAEAAMATRREELKSAEIRERAALERAEAGRVASQNAELRARYRGITERTDQLDGELKDLRALLAARDEENERLESSLRGTQRDLTLRIEEMDALATRFRELTQTAEERKLHIVTVETKLERVSDDLRSSERRSRDLQETVDRLRTDLGTLEGNLKREKLHAQSLDEKLVRLTARQTDRDEELTRYRAAAEIGTVPSAIETSSATSAALPPASRSRSNWGDAGTLEPEPVAANAPLDAAQKLQAALDRRPPSATGDRDEVLIRERISDIAARVIRMTAIAEGPESPISRLLDGPETATGDDAARPSLADRVRLLMEADDRQIEAAAHQPERQPAAAVPPKKGGGGRSRRSSRR